MTAGRIKEPKVGDSIVAKNAGWTFAGDVASHFTDHVSKSVPLYEEGHDIICKIADFFLQDDSICYELGVSTGVLINKLSKRAGDKRVRFFGIDKEQTMIDQAYREIGHPTNVELMSGDINTFDFEPADLIVSYYTLQFVPPKMRQNVMNKLYNSLNWGGGLILFEKVRAPDARFQDMMSTIYTDFKLDQGYNCDEIVGKTRSLKGVQEPFSTQGNIDMMKRAGFVDIMTVQKYICFEGFLAIK